jgi:DNA-binding NtrC family response regulator
MKRLSIAVVENKKRQEKTLRSNESMVIQRTDSGTALSPRPTSERAEPSDGAALHVSSPHVSQKHAQIRYSEDGRVFLKDLNSLNGTYIRVQPYMEVELQSPFEVMVGPDVFLQSQDSLLDAMPSMARFASTDDFIKYVRHKLRSYVEDISLVGSCVPDPVRRSQTCTRVPLLERGAYLVVAWKQATFNLAMERWLQNAVSLYNTKEATVREEPWNFLGTSPERKHTLELARRVAATDGTVLLCGRPGVGKDILARDIARHSSRAKGPFIAVNCATLTKELMEGELFGTEQGAFTGALKREGLFEQASGGTLFLDEIGELPLELQPKLLRVIENRCIRRLGGKGEERPINVRIIAATNRNLEKMVQERTFREDLWFRLDAVKLILPDLGPGDIRSLVPAVLDELGRKGFGEVAPEEEAKLCASAESTRWPGNARHLRNVLERYLTFRQSSRPFQANWDFAVHMDKKDFDDLGPSLSLLAPPASPPPPEPAATETAIAIDIPEDAMKLGQMVEDLVFLHIAQRVLPKTGWGAWAELGRQTKLSGPGAQGKLKNLGVTVSPSVDLAGLATRIHELRTTLAPMLPFLRTMLAV